MQQYIPASHLAHKLGDVGYFICTTLEGNEPEGKTVVLTLIAKPTLAYEHNITLWNTVINYETNTKSSI